MDAEMKDVLTQILSQFDKVNEQIQLLSTRIATVEETTAQTNARLSNVEVRLGNVEVRLGTVEETTARTDLRLENEIGPTVQLLLENQVANNSKLDKLPPMEEKLDDVHSRVQVIEDLVTGHSQAIKTFKQAK